MKSLHFLYHELRPTRSAYSYVVPCEEFVAHCDLYARLRGQGKAGAAFRPEITFDDGHASDLRFAAPVLQERGLKATFFITAGWTGQRAGFMDWSELRDLHAMGHRVGAHGMTHTLLTHCSAAALEEELAGARKRLEDGLGAPVHSMSLPGGRVNERVLRTARQAGYEQIFTSMPQAVEVDSTTPLIGRLNLLSGTTVRWLESVLDPCSGVLKKLERTARIKDAAKTVLGDGLYARLWALRNRQEAVPAEAEEVGAS